MYKTVIDIRNDIPESMARTLVGIANQAFDNRAGKVNNVSVNPYQLIYEGTEPQYGCLDLGIFGLKETPGFLENVSAWAWIDEDPSECCDMLEVFATQVR